LTEKFRRDKLSAMKYLICYDIPEDSVRAKIVRYLEEFAYRMQYSVFNCDLDSKAAAVVWSDLLELVDESDGGTVLMTPLCKACAKNLKLSGKPLEEEKGFLIV